MATVTGYTKEKMDEINDSTVVDGNVVGGSLILETRDGTPITAGSVIGPVGPVGPPGIIVCTSISRPSSPYDGQHIYETNTFKDLVYISAKSGWFPHWNTAWGRLGVATSSGVSFDSTTQIQVTLSSISVRADRNYRITFDIRAKTEVNNTVVAWDLEVNTSGTWSSIRTVSETFSLGSVSNMTETWQWSEDWKPGSNATGNFRFTGNRISSTASTTDPNLAAIRIDDIGPA